MNARNETEDDLVLEGFDDPMSRDLAHAMDVAWLRTKDAPFDEAKRAFQLVEREFILRAGDHEFYVIETKRRVIEAIFKAAYLDEQPFNTCQIWWNSLLQLGFSNIETSCIMSCIYADCCRFNRRPSEGLGTLEPVMAELERLLAKSTVTDDAAEFYRDQLDIMQKRLDELRAQLGKVST